MIKTRLRCDDVVKKDTRVLIKVVNWKGSSLKRDVCRRTLRRSGYDNVSNTTENESRLLVSQLESRYVDSAGRGSKFSGTK